MALAPKSSMKLRYGQLGRGRALNYEFKYLYLQNEIRNCANMICFTIIVQSQYEIYLISIMSQLGLDHFFRTNVLLLYAWFGSYSGDITCTSKGSSFSPERNVYSTSEPRYCIIIHKYDCCMNCCSDQCFTKAELSTDYLSILNILNQTYSS